MLPASFAFSRLELRGIAQVSMLPLSVTVRTARSALESARVLPLVWAALAPLGPFVRGLGVRGIARSGCDPCPYRYPTVRRFFRFPERWLFRPSQDAGLINRPVVTLSGGPVPHLSGLPELHWVTFSNGG
jgi:hypothetical protein